MDVFLGDISFNLVLEFFCSFSSRSSPPFRKFADHCGMNKSINIAFKTRTRCYSFDQKVRKCNDSSVVNIIANNSVYFRTELYLLCYCCCVRHPTHRNSKSRVYPLRCQDSGPPGTPFNRYRKQERNKQKAKHVKKTCSYNRYLVR